ncbi:MAG: 3' terminal RNA ribose 2'-O-methyltransferase Hen1 [Deltaproteobacteria bacterium]|jgi:3' terminal RNA ribose 2'-O-methyltransferase Hen1|nr:3' terminal RNA ribose 2'-O-methyltransferase Hen1 [Deltaproteobacteria bacterium]
MLLTITYRAENADDLGYLLHKHPSRLQKFDLSYGRAFVFYPVVSKTECTAALLLDINPITLVKGREGVKGGGLFDYVNDRPYVCSSFMSTAISRVFGTALSGRCDQKPLLASSALDLTASVSALPLRVDPQMLDRVFVPLGYEVKYTNDSIDENFSYLSQACYVNLTLTGRCLIKDMLAHLYILIPIFDQKKHYYISHSEINKLLTKGGTWLERHPERDFIVRQYLVNQRRLTRVAMERLDNGESGATEEEDIDREAREWPKKNEVRGVLNTRRLEIVTRILLSSGVSSVIDLGCGDGPLLPLLMREKTILRVAGVDVSIMALERARRRLELQNLPQAYKAKLTLFQGSLTYRNENFCGYDAAVCVEVIEHIDKNRLKAFEDVLFAYCRPRLIIITTPNFEYNEKFGAKFKLESESNLEPKPKPGLGPGQLRHGDHRFEWTREQFQSWAKEVSERNGYEASFRDIGIIDEGRGPQTQMGIFSRCD